MPAAVSTFEIRPSRAWRWLRNLLIVAAVASLAGWLWVARRDGDEARAVVALALLLPLFAAASWRCEQGGRLFAQGDAWRFEPPAGGTAGLSGQLVVAADLGDWMLLYLRPSGTRWGQVRRWLALSRSDMPAHWQAFRRAVYSPRPSPAGLSAQAPADPPA